MSFTQTWYLRFTDDAKLETVGCMICNATLGEKKGEKFVHQSHLKTKLLELEDGSKLEIFLCPDCNKLPLNTDDMLTHLERTARWGYMQEVLVSVGRRPELKAMAKKAADMGRRLKLKRGN